jgi:hypothetical protein
MTDAEFREMFEGDWYKAKVRSWLQEGINWHLHDTGDPGLIRVLGPQDMVWQHLPYRTAGSGKLLADSRARPQVESV